VRLFNDIREKLNYWFLKQSLRKLNRQKKFFSFRETSSIGVLYDASTEEQYKEITLLVKDLQKEQKKVKTLGYVNLKKMPDYSFPKLTFEFCSKRDFNWNLKPGSQHIRDFINKDYDVLIDFSPSHFFQTKNLVAESPAHFKVGLYNERFVDLYDMMMQVDENTPQKETIKHTFFYLKMINNDQGDDQQV
jgi:hypothetical protein